MFPSLQISHGAPLLWESGYVRLYVPPLGPCSMKNCMQKALSLLCAFPPHVIINWSALLYQLSAQPAHTPTNAYLMRSYFLPYCDSLMLLWSIGYCGKQPMKYVHSSKRSTCFRLFSAREKNPLLCMPARRHFFIHKFRVGRDSACALRRAEWVKRSRVSLVWRSLTPPSKIGKGSGEPRIIDLCHWNVVVT